MVWHKYTIRLAAVVFRLLLLACLGGGLAAGLRADEAAPATPAKVPPAVAPPQRVLDEAGALKLLTTTLQQNYVKDQGELELSFTEPWTATPLPDKPLTVKILELPSTGVTPYFIIRFQICTTNACLGTWQAELRAHIWRQVWVANSNLRYGEPIAGADISRERFDVLKVHDDLAEFAADNPNLQLAEAVASGYPLLARAVKPRAVIHRGQVADALVQDGALSVTTKVLALEDGAPGQMIRARNPVSNHELSGKVLDSHTILISL